MTFGNSSDPSLRRADPFCSWRWDGNSLTAETDRYGFFPLFYCTTANGLMVSPSLTALVNAGAPLGLDDTAIAVALRCWIFIGDDTPFSAIRVLPPGGRMTWEPGTTPLVTSRLLLGTATEMARTDAIDGYIEHFRLAMRRRQSDGTSVVPLSGGRDSRHIILELAREKRRPDLAVTVGGWRQQTPDSIVAKALADRLGVRHVVVGLPDSRWTAQTRTLSLTHFCTFEHWWLENLTRSIADIGGDVTIYEGVAGDVLSSGLFKTEMRRKLYEAGNLRALAEDILGAEPYFRQVLGVPWYKRFSRERAIDRVEIELTRHTGAPNPMASFLFYNRTRRVTALSPTSLLSPLARVWCPFLDADLWDFLASLGPDMAGFGSASTFHDETIARAYPEHADIPFARGADAKPRPRMYNLRTISEMGAAVGISSGMPLRRSYLLPRLLRGLVDPSYTAGAAELAPMTSYFCELASVAKL